MFIRAFLSVEFWFTFKTYLKGAPFYKPGLPQNRPCGQSGRTYVEGA